MMRSISVIIPNYNGKHLFEKYFEHNFNVIHACADEVEIIVIDDASEDNSVKYLKENYTDKIILIQKEKNSGFSETCNLGIQAAKNELIFLLNTDVKLENNYFKKLYKYFEKTDTFGVMGRVIGMDDDQIQEAARCPKVSGQKIKPSNFFYLKNKNTLTPTFYLSGAIALIDAKKLKTIKGFNEMFNPFYCEDQELSIRAWRLGWKCYYEHDAICRHEISGSTKDHSKKRDIKMVYFRNRYYTHYLHLTGFNLFLWHIQVIFTDIIIGLLTFQFYKAEAYFNVFLNRKHLKTKKDEFQNLMKERNANHSLMDIIYQIRSVIGNKEVVKC
ncbi:glycosyltransferase family 2 protein [Pedobacter glucosidilyticus]|uniref:glycosyltransferase family 2 protein n=1 Tax=Pedobacter glucosidilyticus TaxID=1122941 RepID=UPI0004103BD5|nr:glycosyltransferase family 2 protein [Pedobacter glucosidilyticus]